MQITQIHERFVGTHIVDLHSGEILSTVKDSSGKKKLGTMDKYLGVDTKFPKECMTEEQLIESLSIIDGYILDNTSIYDSFLIENALAGNITIQQQVFLRNLANKVCAWNYVFSNTSKLAELGADKKSLARIIRELEVNWYIKILHKDKPYKGDMTLLVNPYLVWRGDKEYQRQHKSLWYGVDSKE